jgi:Domain of unknown function (DUF397)
MTDRVAVSWRKSHRCGESCHCVEVAVLDEYEQVMMRNSTRPHETISVSRAAFRDLITRIKGGELDV